MFNRFLSSITGFLDRYNQPNNQPIEVRDEEDEPWIVRRNDKLESEAHLTRSSIKRDALRISSSGDEDSESTEALVHLNTIQKVADQAYEKSNEKKQAEHSKLGGLSGLSAQVFIGMGRDLVWGALTYRDTNIFNKKLGAFWGTTWTQTVLSFPVTLAAAKFSLDLRGKSLIFMDNRRAWVKNQLVFALASWSSIPTWNMAQFAGNWCGEKLGLNPIGAGYFSGIFTGIAETIWQNVIVIPRLLNQPVEMTEVVLNTLGGAVWQWVFQANLPSLPLPSTSNVSFTFEDMVVGAEIAGSVAMSTFFMTLLAWEIKRCCAHRNQSELVSLEGDEAGERLIPGSSDDELMTYSESKSVLFQPADTKAIRKDNVPVYQRATI